MFFSKKPVIFLVWAKVDCKINNDRKVRLSLVMAKVILDFLKLLNFYCKCGLGFRRTQKQEALKKIKYKKRKMLCFCWFTVTVKFKFYSC
jgi:hypothetical protein